MASPSEKHTIVIIGAGTGGTAVAAGLKRRRPNLDIAVVDPDQHRDYQPAWTLVGGGAYDGYAACPLTTSVGKVLLAEFTYGGVVTPSFPLDPRVPRRAYWWLKRRFLPWFYWNLLIRGRNLPALHRQRTLPGAIQPARGSRA